MKCIIDIGIVCMDQSLYSYSLCAAIPLMLFFGFHMLLARTPDKKIYSNFLLSRRLMGIAMLVQFTILKVVFRKR